MNPLTIEWINKAEGDYATANREFRVRKTANYDAVCFHAQQCVEKYMKACLQEANIPFAKTHNLIVLLDLLLPIKPNWEETKPKLFALNNFAVNFRYPGDSADKEIARQTIVFCKEIRQLIRRNLNLEE